MLVTSISNIQSNYVKIFIYAENMASLVLHITLYWLKCGTAVKGKGNNRWGNGGYAALQLVCIMCAGFNGV